MGLLDNSGDILLDAVLTDVGRQRLARGDGYFQITKFSLGDDEINYQLYNSSHPSGSAYYDIEILQTPVLEAFTDNGASVKHKLITVPRQDLLYLPILKLNETNESTQRATSGNSAGSFVVCVNKATEELFDPTNGIMHGENPANGKVYIRIDQGLDNNMSPSRPLDDSLIETRYIVEIDNRLGQVISKDGKTRAVPSYVDDDHIASYNFSLGSDLDFVTENTITAAGGAQVIQGPRGTIIQFMLLASLDLNASSYFFTQLGGDVSMTNIGAISPAPFDYIDTIVRVTGVKTGRAIDIPVRYLRAQ